MRGHAGEILTRFSEVDWQKRQYTSPMGPRSLTMPLSASTVAHAEAATGTLCLETSSEGATHDRLENKASPDRTAEEQSHLGLVTED